MCYYLIEQGWQEEKFYVMIFFNHNTDVTWLPGGFVVKSLPTNEVGMSMTSRSGRLPGEGNGTPSMGFPRQEYWSGLPLPSLGNLP